MSESAGETQLQNILGQSLSNTRMLVGVYNSNSLLE